MIVYCNLETILFIANLLKYLFFLYHDIILNIFLNGDTKRKKTAITLYEILNIPLLSPSQNIINPHGKKNANLV